MKLTKQQLKQLIKEELQKTILKEQNEGHDKCGPKPVWPGNAKASIKMDPTKKVLADQRAWYSCKKKGTALPEGYPSAPQNRILRPQNRKEQTKTEQPAEANQLRALIGNVVKEWENMAMWPQELRDALARLPKVEVKGGVDATRLSAHLHKQTRILKTDTMPYFNKIFAALEEAQKG